MKKLKFLKNSLLLSVLVFSTDFADAGRFAGALQRAQDGEQQRAAARAAEVQRHNNALAVYQQEADETNQEFADLKQKYQVELQDIKQRQAQAMQGIGRDIQDLGRLDEFIDETAAKIAEKFQDLEGASAVEKERIQHDIEMLRKRLSNAKLHLNDIAG